ncbi:MAG: tyrosine--tRNA ligase [Clostridia bacterium]|nr:tyrosine--tRNA ligase [Clostridia bacterium]
MKGVIHLNTVYEELKSRDLIKQIAFEDEFEKLAKEEKFSVYLGIDPTADSIHIGHFMPLMIMSYFQKHGHRPILLMGGGTALIGDPSGKSDMRKMLTKEDIDNNVEKIKKQVSKFVSFEGENGAIIVNNADWILNLNYMDFIRTYGVHFNVNRMLDAECFKMRMEKGLTFFELNYMLMQSYDFLKLFETENCRVQIGGDDQWSNMLAGVDLIRKIHKSGSFCVTCPLLLNSDGTKMGKTVKGALWLDPEKTTPYEFYQYWRNIEDASVNQVLRSLTYLPMDEVNRLSNLKDEHINEAKKIAAFEITKLIHGEEEALKAKQTAEELFENRQNADNMPTVEIAKDSFVDETIGLLDVMVVANVAKSKGEGKTLIAGGGVSIDDEKVTDIFKKLTLTDFEKGYVVLKKGKKVFIKLVIK